MNTSGEGKYKVFLDKYELDDDLIYIVGGGEKSHIGGMVFCEPDKEPMVIRLENHYDYIVLEPIAKLACKKYNKKVLAIGGVHVDNASRGEIEVLVNNCRSLTKFL